MKNDPIKRAMLCTRFLAVLFLGWLLLATGCASIQTDIRYDTEPGLSSEELLTIEIQLVALRTQPNQELLANYRSRLQELRRVPGSDPLYRARLEALSAEAFLLAGNRREAEARMREGKNQYAGDEIVLLVEARLQADIASRLRMLEQAIRSADSSLRLRAELGSTLLAAGRYREALAAFDSALPKLPEEYSLLFQVERDKAWALRDASMSVQAASASYLTPQPISLIGMLVVVQQESSLMEWFTGGANWSPGVVFERGKAARWFADESLQADSPATRKDVALLLWNLLARGQNQMLKRYSTRYAARASSPVPDVEFGSAWFDAVLGLVEENIMTLPDGRNFRPNDTVSGLDFFGFMTNAVKFR